MTCAPIEDSDQSEHPPSLIRVFAVRMSIPRVLNYPFSTQRRPWSDWALGGYAQSYLSLRWGLRTLCLFCLAAAYIYIYISRFLSLGRTHGLGRLELMMMLSHCQFHGASDFDYKRAQSVLHSTGDINFVGLILLLILSCHILSVLLFLSLSRDARHIWHRLHPSYFWKRLFIGILKQVAQRATIAHLSPMCQHPFISNKPANKVIKNLNSFQIREQLFFQGLVPPMSAVWTCQKSNLL